MDDTSRSRSTRAAHHIVAGILAATAAIAAAPADAAVDMFLKLDGIKGESKDDKHPGEIDVLSWSWGASKGSGQRSNPNQPCGRQLEVTKWVDKATPGLVHNMVLGSTIPNAELTVQKAGDRPLAFLVLKLKGVFVTSYSTSGSSDDTSLTESVSFAFSGGEMTYTPQKEDGTAGASVSSPLPATCP